MRAICLVSVLALIAASPALAAPPPEPAVGAQAAARPTYTAAQFFETTSYGMASGSGLAWSPDGRSVLISSDVTGVFNAYALPAAGGAPVPLSASTGVATFAASYFPNDARVLLTADSGGGGSELTHVYVRELDGTVRDLTPGAAVKADLLGWSGDRSRFWITSNARDSSVFDVYSVDPTTYETTLLFENPDMNISAISPDGRWVALDKSISSADSDVYLVDLQGDKEPRLITEHTGNVAWAAYDFTADSQAARECPAKRAQAEARVDETNRCVDRSSQVVCIVTRLHRLTDNNLFTAIVEIAVAVPIDPGVQHASTRRSYSGNHWIRTGVEHAFEQHALFIVHDDGDGPCSGRRRRHHQISQRDLLVDCGGDGAGQSRRSCCRQIEINADDTHGYRNRNRSSRHMIQLETNQVAVTVADTKLIPIHCH